MPSKVLERIASQPWIYDKIQLVAGARIIYARLASQISSLGTPAIVLDLGGGTGLSRHIWPSDFVYLCLDMDKPALQRFRRKSPDCSALLADATSVPIKDNSVDVVVCIVVSHHLLDTSVVHLIDESRRILKSTGTFLFLDAVWEPERWLGRLLWKYDRGSYPHTVEYLYSVISRQYSIVHREQFAIWHKYILCRGIKRFKGSECQIDLHLVCLDSNPSCMK